MDVDTCIRENIIWQKLPEDIRVLLGNSQREYDKLVLEYSIKNQLRYKGNLVRHVKKSEETYYDMIIKYSESHLMLYPYHLADIIVKELRITPFNYYINIITDMIQSEKSYDSLPNFTAADAVRLLGIGRNQYIDLMNQNSGIVANLTFQVLTEDERRVVDSILDEGPQPAGFLPVPVVQSLLNRGLIYVDVPVEEFDYVYVAPLDGFVMNRVLGDYFETLLYKIFVAIDDQTTVKEMADMLHIDFSLVANAISVFCRLGFAKKRVTGMETARLHYSWAQLVSIPNSPTQDDLVTSVSGDLGELSASLASPLGDDDDEEQAANLSNYSLKDSVS
ncbi:hypothetical protein TELCIR_13455 [Teladorsagia circumcincta]|uniref:FAM91 N-terminal domain-containing protein n=1 Tax=Teladorsagia circumcincta TaxID=45464 RepID=A0A2G9U5B9_TELCI|nr:hypothetical protein TELCIR_13455 [Teladorsagia circumcincta]